MRPCVEQTAIPAEDEAAIRNLAESLVAAWNAGDGTAYGRAFTEDCDYVTFNGRHVCGRAAVAASHQALFDTHLRGSKLIFESLHMRPLSEGAILVHGVGNSLLRGQRRPRKSRRSLQTLVALRTENGWLFTAFHNTRIFEITPFRAILMMLGI